MFSSFLFYNTSWAFTLPMFSLLAGHFSFSVALADDGKFLLCARKYRRPACSEYLISLDVCDVSKGKGTYIGKLR
jgi:hypothetical protein